jgi:hypothetical protein
MSENSRPRGVIVYPMPESIGGPTVYGRYALMVRRSPDGSPDLSEVRMVHTEGVAYLVTTEKPWRWTDYAECDLFSPEELWFYGERPDSDGVDLADWVRTFGARLESNFSQCYRWATSVPTEA